MYSKYPFSDSGHTIALFFCNDFLTRNIIIQPVICSTVVATVLNMKIGNNVGERSGEHDELWKAEAEEEIR